MTSDYKLEETYLFVRIFQRTREKSAVEQTMRQLLLICDIAGQPLENKSFRYWRDESLMIFSLQYQMGEDTGSNKMQTIADQLSSQWVKNDSVSFTWKPECGPFAIEHVEFADIEMVPVTEYFELSDQSVKVLSSEK
ncbi:MAG: hypothetical protein R3C11_22035 [Planctomycetaceae bacterium]